MQAKTVKGVYKQNYKDYKEVNRLQKLRDLLDSQLAQVEDQLETTVNHYNEGVELIIEINKLQLGTGGAIYDEENQE